MHFKNVDHWVYVLYKKILNTFTLLKDCTSVFFNDITVICDSSAMADSKPINFEKQIKLTSCEDILLDFLRKNNALFSSDSVCTYCGHAYRRRRRGEQEALAPVNSSHPKIA